MHRLPLTLVLALVAVVVARAEESAAPVDEDDVALAGNDDASVPDRSEFGERQGRAPLQTESPTGKARREQALRNILAARRRKVMRQRTPGSSSEASVQRRSSQQHQRRGKPLRETVLGDLLEMQESQNGLYVTVPEQQSANETQEIVIETLASASSPKRNSTSSKTNRGSGGSMEQQQRAKKIVAMPASLYNHFRPVESNIPIEDMSQFLYFGQKLRGTGMGKDSSPASPPPKKLLAGLEEMLDDEMNSVDKSSGSASKSTKMRTTSLREQTTKPACPDKTEAEARGNSINATNAEKSSQDDTSAAGLSLRIVVTEATTLTPPTTTLAPINGTTGSSTTTTTTTTTSATTAVVSSTTAASASSFEGSSKPAIASRKKHQEPQQPQHVTDQSAAPRQRASAGALRNSSVGAGAAAETGGGASRLSAGATVEPATAPPRPAASSAAQPQQRHQPQQPGFTIRWTDARPASAAASKRRRLAASRRRDKSAKTMEEPTTTTTTTAATTLGTTTEGANATVLFPVAPETVTTPTTTAETTLEDNTVTTEKELPTTTLAKMLDPSEVQKMYRAGSTPKPEVSTSTMTTSSVPSTEIVEETTTPTTTTTSSTMPPPPPPPPSRSPERSPEVRARNLADKAKDDVLPIMQLYNTSSIFNASESPGTKTSATTSSTTTTTTTTVLPTAEATSETTTIVEPVTGPSSTTTASSSTTTTTQKSTTTRTTTRPSPNKIGNRTGSAKPHRREFPGEYNGAGYYPFELTNNASHNRTFFEPPAFVTVAGGGREPAVNISEVISRRHDGDALASQETVAVVSYILATLLVFPIALGVGLILRRLILRNRKVLEESDTSSEISCRKDALNLETGDFKMSIEKTITKLPRIQHLCHEAEKPPPPTSQESRWEFPRDKLRLQTVLGEGNFGQVWKAEADDLTGHQGTTRLVAVKTVKEGASDREKEDLVRELEIMQRVGSHPNVVTLLGCCTEQEPHYLILEYVMYGKLLAYLRDHRTRQDFYNFSEDSAALTSRDLTVFGYCVARGMEYLASKKIIHRDLAARNVLVDHNKLCKIADFGMSRFANEDGEVIETRHGRNALPIRWMAPESLIYSLFTTKTDVWSFGILMWEIVTLGSTPYQDMTAREVMRSVQSGYRLERPSHCRSELFRVIARCWHSDPDRRPEFQVLRRDLAQLLEDSMNGHYVDLESFASECPD